MSTLELVFTCFVGQFGAGYLIAGFVMLLSFDQAKVADLKRRADERLASGLYSAHENYQWLRRKVLPLSVILAHWRSRPEVRSTIYRGLAFLLAALISGHFASFPR